MKVGSIVAALAALAIAPAAAVPAASGAPRRASVSVVTAPGATGAVQRTLRARGFRVDRRAGRRLQVVVRGPSQRRVITRLPGVAAVVAPQSAYGDVVTSQGVDRTGASSLADVGNGGAGLRIAVLDLGFGTEIPALQARGELPPPRRLTLQSFDPAGGIFGSNAYGNPTDHGELVAQTIYDYVPRAHYLFVSYHTPEDFAAAVDWIIGQGVDVVVHSNNFLEGPFDGTSPTARAVDRAAAAGILWFNSGGNYGEKHWSGPWSDPDADGQLDWPTPWTVTHEVNHALTFHLSWANQAGGPPSDIDLFLDRQRDDGSGWDVVATSTDRQSAGALPAERIAGIRPQQPGVYRLRARLVSGPPPKGDLTLFAREDDIVSWSGSTAYSTPTPADAAGSISVGAIDWRSNSLVRYSSRGPTADGRLKPDISAPTGTRLATPGGDPREVGGTSIAAPNAAGAAALELASMRAAGLRPTVDEMRAILSADALDLGDPGPDDTFGAGRLRVDVDAPTLLPAADVPPHPVRGALRLAVEAADASPLATWALEVDGVRRRIGRLARELVETRIETRELADGPHAASIDVSDIVGNMRRRSWRFVVDNTAPALELKSVDVRRPVAAPTPPTPARAPSARRRKRTVLLVVAASDAMSPLVRIVASLTAVGGAPAGRRTLTLQDAAPRRFVLAKAPKGLYVVRIVASDDAGNASTVTRGLRIR